ncbi:uncharacterized protein LOC108041179 [Drosophila rhopaloa]|uniref:5'-3' DNA helicase ZGRF1-like N-terminal domain-containing protein n=1 Tax=Drosophila rhopaloa TaxID=1041015 RepID=A0ABM5H4U0_DRORH|nr:uncharacterized protein LOC108041179 [Drosophila rhopaloa]
MRRSKAPSMRQAAKREIKDPEPPEDPEAPYSWPSITPTMEWGSSNGSENLGPRELKAGENPLKESRIFHVLWRNQTTKKHKTWTGNGTLVVTGSKVVLKDDTGKVVDNMTCFKQRDFKENDQLQIGSKDVEVQEEIKTLQECVTQRKLEIASWCKKIDAQNGMESEVPVTSASCRSHVLKRTHQECSFDVQNPRLSGFTTTGMEPPPHEKRMREESPSVAVIPPRSEFTQVEYLCLLAPAELQEKILHFLADYIKNCKVVRQVCFKLFQLVCDHPVLLKTLVKHADFEDLMQVMEPKLPPWLEMDIYDSAKFEFVHRMLDYLVVEQGEKCCILANRQDCLKMAIGYCQSYDISHEQLDSPQKVAMFNSGEEGSPMVALVLSSDLPKIGSVRCKNLIIYNYNAREKANELLATGEIDTKIYTPVTSGGCPEELQFYRRLGLKKDGDTLGDLQNYRRELIPSTKHELATWTKIEPLFSVDFLKEVAISDSLENIQLVYSKKGNVEL